jgi:hypothetical protein
MQDNKYQQVGVVQFKSSLNIYVFLTLTFLHCKAQWKDPDSAYSYKSPAKKGRNKGQDPEHFHKKI